MGAIVRSDEERADTRKSRDSWRFLLLFALPTYLFIAALIAPLVTGRETLYFRDVFNLHLPMKSYQAEQLRSGDLPSVDLTRAGGQANLGNPNTVPLYPDNLLYLLAPFWWAFNAHFWIHWLLAPWAGFWLGRAWGLSPPPAWALGVFFATSGFYLSALNFYNLIAVVTLAPAVVAAFLGVRRGRKTGFVAAWLAWTLLLLAGDPVTASIVWAVAMGAVLVRGGSETSFWGIGIATASGVAATSPQWVEFLRILPSTFRGHWGYSEIAATVASWDPRTVVDLFVPFAFGRLDFNFWGQAFFSGQLPFFFTLFVGLLVWAAAACARPSQGRAFFFAVFCIVVGLLLSLGQFNPLFHWLLRLPGASLVRLPIKFWIVVQLGLCLLGALGLERWLESSRGRRSFVWALGGVGFAVTMAWMALTMGWLDAGLRSWIPDRFAPQFAEAERVRWAGSLLLLLVVLACTLATAWAGRRHPRVALAIFLALHAASSLFFLRDLLARDSVAPYESPPFLAQQIPRGARVVHGHFNDLLRPEVLPVSRFPDPRPLWRQRHSYEALSPWAGKRWGLRYEMDLSPEGLDSFLTQVTAQAVQRLGDDEALRVLAASGVQYLVMEEELASPLLEQVARHEALGGPVYLYRIAGAAEPVQVVGRVTGSENLNQALGRVVARDFDPRREVVLAGPVAVSEGPSGEAIVVSETSDQLEVQLQSPNGGAVVIQRSHSPLYRARLDGNPVPIVAANMHRLGVVVPPGDHRLVIEVDRRPFWASVLLSFLVVGGVLATGWRARAMPDVVS